MNRNAFLYPHKCYALRLEQSEPDSKGDYSDPVDVWELIGECRAETNGSGREIATADGIQTVFSNIVYFPPESPVIGIGTQIVVLSERIGNTEYLSDAQMLQIMRQTGQLKASGSCLVFDKTRLHSRMWVK